MKNNITLTVLFLTIIGFATTATADDAGQKLQINGAVYGDFYNYDLTSNAGGTNGFNLDQLDIMARYVYNSNWDAFVMTGLGPDDPGVGFTVGQYRPYFKQAKIDGNNLWGDGSQLQFGLVINPHFVMVDMPLNTWWLGIYSMAMGDFLEPFYDTGVAASGKIADLTYSVFIETGTPTYLRGGSSTPPFSRNGLSYEGILKYQIMKGLAVLGEDTYTPGSSAGVLASSSENYVEGALVLNHEWVDLTLEGAYFKHSQAGTTDNDFVLAGGSIPGPVSFTGYDAQANIKLSQIGANGWTVFGRYQFGNTDFARALGGYKSQLTAGPTYSWMDGRLGVALLYDISEAEDSTVAARQFVSARFKAFF